MSVTLRLGPALWGLASLGLSFATHASEDLPPPRGEAVFEESKGSSATKPLQWAAGLHPVLWNDNYKLGWGLSSGLRMRLAPALEAGGEVLYTRFRPHIRGFVAKNEFGSRLFALHALHLPTPFTLKLGAYIGFHRFSNDDESHAHIAVGGEAQAAFDFVSPWGLYLQFSPGYAFGDQGEGLFRLGLGATYNIGGRLGKQPKAKLQPPPQEEAERNNSASDAIDFGGTMVPLPEPDQDTHHGSEESKDAAEEGGSDPVLKDLSK